MDHPLYEEDPDGNRIIANLDPSVENLTVTYTCLSLLLDNNQASHEYKRQMFNEDMKKWAKQGSIMAAQGDEQGEWQCCYQYFHMSNLLCILENQETGDPGRHHIRATAKQIVEHHGVELTEQEGGQPLVQRFEALAEEIWPQRKQIIEHHGVELMEQEGGQQLVGRSEALTEEVRPQSPKKEKSEEPDLELDDDDDDESDDDDRDDDYVDDGTDEEDDDDYVDLDDDEEGEV